MESFATPIRGSERARKPNKSPSSWKKNIKKTGRYVCNILTLNYFCNRPGS